MVGGQPRRVLTLFDSTCLTVGVIFGAGVLVTAPEVARGVDSARGVLAIWVIGGLLSLCGAVGYAELATTYPEQGGDYFYLTRAYGRWAGFLFGWIQTLVVRPGDIAVMAYVFAAFAEPIVGGIRGGKPALAAAVVALLTVVNMAGVRLGARTQNSLTVAKLAGVLVVIAAAVFAGGGPGGAANQTVAVDPLPVSVAFILVLFSFGGWNELVFVAAEVRDPTKNIIRAMTLGMAVVTVIYLALNTAFLRMLGYTGLALSDSAAVDTLAPIFPARASVFVAVLACLCALGAVNGLIFAGARIAYAVGKDHCLFGALGRWSVRTGTPVPALALQGALSVALILALGSFIDTVMYTAAAVYLFYLVTSAAVVVLRYREPAAPRPYRATGFPVTTLTFCLVCGFLVIAAVDYRPTMAVASLMVILLGVPAFRLSELAGRRRSIRPDSSRASGETDPDMHLGRHPYGGGRPPTCGGESRPNIKKPMKGESMNKKAIRGVLVLALMLGVGLHSEASRGSDSDGMEGLEKRKGAFKSILVNPVTDFSKYSSVYLTAVVLEPREHLPRRAPTATGSLVGKRSRKPIAPDERELSELRRVVRETIVSEFGSMEGMELTLEPDAATLLLRASVTDMVFVSSRKSEDGTRVPVLAQGVIEFELIDSETGLLVGRMFERRKCNTRKRPQSTDQPLRLWSEVEPWVQQGATDLQGELSNLGG